MMCVRLLFRAGEEQPWGEDGLLRPERWIRVSGGGCSDGTSNCVQEIFDKRDNL
jgi:hypothetical protein